MKNILPLALAGLLAGAIALVIKSWILFNDVTITPIGYAALAAGSLLSLALGSGLLRVMFRSEQVQGIVEDDETGKDGGQ